MHRSPVPFFAYLVAVAGLLLPACSGPSIPPILDAAELLERHDWWDNRDRDWYLEKIPFFDSPDNDLNATYYYRWELLTKHLTYGSPSSGYTFTEFIDRPFWSGSYGAISCPLGHQAYEVRWLKDRRVIEDFARYWFETPGAEPRSYSNWYGDAMWATYAVLGDRGLLEKVYPHMRAQVSGWTREHWDPDHRMYRWVGAWDGMETNINSRLTEDEFGGAEGFRPTLNSYLFADFMALSRAAGLLGREDEAAEYEARGLALKKRVQEELWDPDREFFFHQFAHEEQGGIQAKTLTYESGPLAGDPHGRELLGYVPWQFNLPDEGYEGAWRFLEDSEFFRAPFGPTGVEQGDPQFFVSPRCCVWSGNAWPYATSQTLTAMANLLNNYRQAVVTKDDYINLLRTYALSHRMNDRPYLAEAADPFTGSWSGHNTFYHSEHYLHSGFVDLVITGLVGLRPSGSDTLVVNPLAPDEWDYFALEGVDYHGHDLAIVWDKYGAQFGVGPGLAVFLDGLELARRPDLGEIRVVIPSPVIPEPPIRLNNYAVNNEREHFPLATASHSYPTTPAFFAVDGNRWYHPSPPNRWTAAGSGNGSDWFEVDFGVERRLKEVIAYFLDDLEGPSVEAVGEMEGSGYPTSTAEGFQGLFPRGGYVARPPVAFELVYWDGEEWRGVPGQARSPAHPTGRRANHVSFPELSTSRIRLSFQHQEGATTGLTELEAWGPGEGPLAGPVDPPRNLAWNPGDLDFPRVRASYTSPYDSVGQATDGLFGFTRNSRNRWTAFESPNTEDWLEVEFEEAEGVARVELFFFGDGRGVAAPEAYRMEVWTGSAWEPAGERDRDPEVPTAWAVNTLTIEPVETTRIRVYFQHSLPEFTGLTEVRVWPG